MLSLEEMSPWCHHGRCGWIPFDKETECAPEKQKENGKCVTYATSTRLGSPKLHPKTALLHSQFCSKKPIIYLLLPTSSIHQYIKMFAKLAITKTLQRTLTPRASHSTAPMMADFALSESCTSAVHTHGENMYSAASMQEASSPPKQQVFNREETENYIHTLLFWALDTRQRQRNALPHSHPPQHVYNRFEELSEKIHHETATSNHQYVDIRQLYNK